MHFDAHRHGWVLITHVARCLTEPIAELFYGGETVSVETPQAFTCPFCSRMGFTEALLLEHVNAEHIDASTEVVSCCRVDGERDCN